MKEIKSGNATIIINSPLTELTEEERKAWFDMEMAKGNPVLKRIAKAMNDCYKDYR